MQNEDLTRRIIAAAMSYLLDDEATRAAHGLVKFSRLAQLYPKAKTRYKKTARMVIRLIHSAMIAAQRWAFPSIEIFPLASKRLNREASSAAVPFKRF
ncbi:MAG: hypothetical protein Fur002_25400 [Anaerolineales bacterium]